MRFLIDTSALVRVVRRQVDERWYEQVELGLVAVCEPVLVETLTIAAAGDYDMLEDRLSRVYPWVAVPDDAWAKIVGIRRALAAKSAHQGLSVADYLVVATALHHRLTVLHEDADYETVTRVLPGFRQQRISAVPD